MTMPVAGNSAAGAGRLKIGGCDAVILASTYGIPSYVYDEQGLRDSCRRFGRAFGAAWPRVSVAYAGKAFVTVAMLRLAAEEGLDLDLASAGEPLACAARRGADQAPHSAWRGQDEC
jgi:diaminopimelate decarboxylase